jgi:hypothetical protein
MINKFLNFQLTNKYKKFLNKKQIQIGGKKFCKEIERKKKVNWEICEIKLKNRI